MKNKTSIHIKSSRLKSKRFQIHLHKLALILALLLAVPTAVQTQEEPGETREAAIARARHFLALNDAEAKELAKKLTPVEAKALVTQVLNLKRNSNPELDRLFVLIQHLDNIRASELAQARLDKLLLVLSLVLGLFSIYLLFLLLDQKKTLQKMQQLSEHTVSGEQKQADTQVFRG